MEIILKSFLRSCILLNCCVCVCARVCALWEVVNMVSSNISASLVSHARLLAAGLLVTWPLSSVEEDWGRGWRWRWDWGAGNLEEDGVRRRPTAAAGERRAATSEAAESAEERQEEAPQHPGGFSPHSHLMGVFTLSSCCTFSSAFFFVVLLLTSCFMSVEDFRCLFSLLSTFSACSALLFVSTFHDEFFVEAEVLYRAIVPHWHCL